MFTIQTKTPSITRGGQVSFSVEINNPKEHEIFGITVSCMVDSFLLTTDIASSIGEISRSTDTRFTWAITRLAADTHAILTFSGTLPIDHPHSGVRLRAILNSSIGDEITKSVYVTVSKDPSVR